MKLTFKSLFTGILTLLCVIVFSINSSFAQGENVVDVVKSSEEHTVFAEMLEESNITEILTQQGPYTVLAPTDDAFEAMGSKLDELKEDSQKRQNMLANHLFQGSVSAEEVEPSIGVEVKEGDIDASNGVVHVLDEVITSE